MSPYKQYALVSELTTSLSEVEEEAFQISREAILTGKMTREQEVRLAKILGRADALIYILNKVREVKEAPEPRLTVLEGGGETTQRGGVKLRDMSKT